MSHPRRVLVTGANGFVGRAVVRALLEDPCVVVSVATRQPWTEPHDRLHAHVIPGIDGTTDWRAALERVDAIVHTAARVHQLNDTAADPLDAFRRVNTAGTLALASQAAAAGVRRIVFLSSIKVNGEGTAPGRPYTADDTPNPGDPYGVSKLEAEEGLQALWEKRAIETVVIRPPLVYGPGVKANFRALMSIVARGWPLPLGGVTGNRRSLVGLDNLVSLILTCVVHPDAAGQRFLVSDGHDLSTAALVREMGKAVGRPPRKLPVPPGLLTLLGSLARRRDVVSRLTESLQVDIRKTRTVLGWQPPVSVEEGLRRAAQEWRP